MAKRLASIRLTIDPGQIYFLKFILEAYDGLAILSTVDKVAGLVELRYPQELQPDLQSLLEAMKNRLGMTDNC